MALQNDYTAKVKLSGKQIEVKEYDVKQYRVRKKGNARFMVEKEEYPYIVDHASGQIFDSVEAFKEGVEEDKEVSKTDIFYVSQKFNYHALDEERKYLVNKIKTLKRTRERITDLINCNIDYRNLKNLCMLTLDFKENLQDIKEANQRFTQYIQELNKKIFTVDKIQYLAVLENQGRGAIHYHVIIFNAPFIHWSVYKKLWGHGDANIGAILIKSNGKLKSRKIEFKNSQIYIDEQPIKNIGAYLSKTFEYVKKNIKMIIEKIENEATTLEELHELKDNPKYAVIFTQNAKLYQCSRNLKKPIVNYCYVEDIAHEVALLEYFYFDEYIVFTLSFEQEEFYGIFGKITTKTFTYNYDVKAINLFIEDVKKRAAVS